MSNIATASPPRPRALPSCGDKVSISASISAAPVARRACRLSTVSGRIGPIVAPVRSLATTTASSTVGAAPPSRIGGSERVEAAEGAVPRACIAASCAPAMAGSIDRAQPARRMDFMPIRA
ncbi:hypothetical protein [Pseudomonas sp. CGJS7]|uniref:hypothetical protein n=1 Tax=Pseudomonas sp. CGJS7 TaxID=3109348 RepID=UPI003009350E